MAEAKISLNYQNRLEIDTTPTATIPTWVQICEGFSNLTPALNEVLHQASYLCSRGWGSTEVTGGQYTLTLTGVRYFGDPAQEFIFSDTVMYNFGNARKTRIRITRGDATVLEWRITLANLVDGGGDANQPGAISVTIHGNGPPTLLGGYLAPLSVVSVPADEPGETDVYVNPLLTSGNVYRYQVGAQVSMPLYDEVLSTGWTVWNGTDPITAVTGNKLVIAEVESATNKARKAGAAEVTTG